MSASTIGAQDLVVFGAVGLAAAWFVVRAVRRRRRRSLLGDAAPACDSCPGCQALGVTPEQTAEHLKAGAAGPNPEATAAKRVIKLTGTGGPPRH